MRLTEIWTHARATRIGFIGSLGALIFWPLHAIVGQPARPVFIAALLLTTACGASLLLMGLADLLTVKRDRRVLPACIFDLALGAAWAIPAGLALITLLD